MTPHLLWQDVWGVMPCVPPLQALVCLERLIAGQPPHQEGLMRAKSTDSEGRDMPALHCILQVRTAVPAVKARLLNKTAAVIVNEHT